MNRHFTKGSPNAYRTPEKTTGRCSVTAAAAPRTWQQSDNASVHEVAEHVHGGSGKRDRGDGSPRAYYSASLHVYCALNICADFKQYSIDTIPNNTKITDCRYSSMEGSPPPSARQVTTDKVWRHGSTIPKQAPVSQPVKHTQAVKLGARRPSVRLSILVT